MHRRNLVRVLLLALLPGACSQSENHPASSRHVRIGREGGALDIGEGAVTLTVPAGALNRDLDLTIVVGRSTPLTGWLDIGFCYEFGPPTTVFATPADLVLPYDPTRLSAAVDLGEFRVAHRDAAGGVRVFPATFVDPDGFHVGASVSELGTWWVVVPDVVSAAALWPLNHGDQYRYDSGLELAIARTTTEPNLGGQSVIKVTLRQGGTESGLYFDDSQGLARWGEFASTWQEISATPSLWLAPRDGIGVVRPTAGVYSGYTPFGSTRVAYEGSVGTVAEILERVPVTVPRGSYGAVRVVITVAFRDTRPQQGEERLELWLVEGIGPVALRIGPQSAPVQRLVAATVGGRDV